MEFVVIADVEGLPPDLEAHGVDAVVVATPTPTHADVVADVRRRWSGRIVVEKPAATTPAGVRRLLGDDPVDLVYHAAFAPEVEWAVVRSPRWVTEHGPIVRVDQRFADPYATDVGRATATLGDSWVDGGINALSVAMRLVDLVERRRLTTVPDLVSTFEAELTTADGAEVRVTTSWAATEPSKRTDIRFADGAHLVLDHQATQGRLGDEWFASPGPPGRLVQHYIGCFTRLFVEGGRSFPVTTDRLLHDLLSP